MTAADSAVELAPTDQWPAGWPGLPAQHRRQLPKKTAGAQPQRASAKKQPRAAQEVAVHGLAEQVMGASARLGAAARHLPRTSLAV